MACPSSGHKTAVTSAEFTLLYNRLVCGDGQIATHRKLFKTRMWANVQRANVMVALPNIGGALCSTPQTLADAHY